MFFGSKTLLGPNAFLGTPPQLPVERARPQVQRITTAGGTPTFSTPDAGGDAIEAGTVLEVRNVSTSPTTVTIRTGVEVDGFAVEDAEHVIAAGVELRALLSRRPFAQPGGSEYRGLVLVDYADPGAVQRAVTRAG